MNNISKIRALNDRFRQTGKGGRIITTVGFSSLPAIDQNKIMDRVREFEAFGTENDPFGEHDFGIIETAECAVLWKIDYYDGSLSMTSPDPSDDDLTVRILTIMLSNEY